VARCHGGILLSFAVMAFGLACNTLGNLSVAIDAHITFIKGAGVGDGLRAHAWCISGSRKTAVCQADLSRDNEIVTTFASTVFVTGKVLSDHLLESPETGY